MINSKDLEVIARLKYLIHKADNELTTKYEKQYYPYGYDESEDKYEIIQRCLNSAYGEIWDEYWKVSCELSFSFDFYYSDTTYQTDIEAHYNALKQYLENQNIDIENVDLKTKNTIEDYYNELIYTFDIDKLCLLKSKLDKYINDNI